MPVFELKITATATIEETWHVTADTEDEATDLVDDGLHEHTFIGERVVGDEEGRELLSIRELAEDERCASGMHDWVDDPSITDPNHTCGRCGEPYGNPEGVSK